MKKLENLTWKGSRDKPIVLDAHWEDKFDRYSVVILAHGYKGFKDWGAWGLVADEFSKRGFLFIKFNFSYNGGTADEPIDFPDLEAFGENNYSTEVADFKRVIDFVYKSDALPRHKLNLDDLCIIGHSRGGGMAILTAFQDNRVKRLVTLASICDLEKRQLTGESLEKWKKTGVRFVENARTKQQMPHFYQIYEDYVINKENLNILKAAKSLTLPWLIVHGEADKAVLFSEAEELALAQPLAKLINILNTNHVFGAKHPWKSSRMPEKLGDVTNLIIDYLNT